MAPQAAPAAAPAPAFPMWVVHQPQAQLPPVVLLGQPVSAPVPYAPAPARAAPGPGAGQGLNPTLPGLDALDLVSILRNAGVSVGAGGASGGVNGGITGGTRGAAETGPASGWGEAGSGPGAVAGAAPAAWGCPRPTSGGQPGTELLPPQLGELLGQLRQK